MKFNIYFIIYYILYKFSRIVAPKYSDKKDFADSAFLSLTLCVFFATLFIFGRFNIWNTLLDSYKNTMIFFGFLLLLLYYINRWVFIRNEKYVEIVKYFDSKIKLNNIGIILISLFIMLGSFFTFLLLM